MCNEKGIELIHVFENEWLDKKEIVQSIILSKLKKFKETIHSKECIIKEVITSEKIFFLQNNHIQGDCFSSVNIGLWYKNELVSIVCFNEISTNNFKLLRFCDKLNTQVINSFDKILNYFQKTNSIKKITVLSDKRYNNSGFYENFGFNILEESPPNYFYVKRRKLKNRNDIFDSSEWENMKLNGYDRIWDCGCIVYEK
jgi:hypothetical protein